MPLSNNPFSQNTEQYERWYDEYPAVYQSELNAIRHFWPPFGEGLEVGVGAAHFAAPLGITYGVEPSAPMRSAALKRGVAATDAVAEALPFPDNRFDAVLMVNTLCFVADRLESVHEMFRVLRDGGCAVLAFVDRNSFLGEEYERKRSRSMFYRDAHFVSVPEAVEILLNCGFEGLDTCQTVFVHPDEMTTPDSVEPGYGRGAFVVIIGRKPFK
jgi:SAM-dependent methyltransferase